MRNYRHHQFLSTILFVSFLFACTNENKNVQPLTGKAKADSLTRDEMLHPIDHQHLNFAQRSTIRPVYQEIEKNRLAEHDGYLLNVSLINKAKETSYKHIEIEINYTDRSGASLGTENVSIKKSIKPGELFSDMLKIKNYKNTSYSVKLKNATGFKNNSK